MGLFGIGVSDVVEMTKSVITAIFKWIGGKIWEWIKANWQYFVILLLGLVIVVLVKVILIKIQVAPILKSLGLMSS